MEDMERTGIPVNNMPELPEVETVIKVLKPILINRVIKDIEILKGHIVQCDYDDFKHQLINHRIKNITRRGKYIIFHLSDDIVLISHLRMEGKYYDYSDNSYSKYAKVIFHLDNGHRLIYDDSRGFGVMMLSDEAHYKSLDEIAKLGPEPFDKIDINDILMKVKDSSTAIKSKLLEQTLFTGLGNIYVDEVLYLSHIHPQSEAKTLSYDDWNNIINNARKVLTKAISLGGSTIKSYHPGKDISGEFQNELLIYGKKDELCPNCHHRYIFSKTNGRGTTICLTCQHKHAKQLIVGLTGTIASGKSLVLYLFKKYGCSTISLDEMVAKLYLRKDITDKISQSLNIEFANNVVDKKILREKLANNPKDKNKLEKIIFKEIKKELINTLKHIHSPLVVVEAPTLFEANMEGMFDTLIIVESDKENTISRLKKRNPSSYKQLQLINQHSKVTNNKDKAEFIIDNNSTVEHLDSRVKEIINILQSRLS